MNAALRIWPLAWVGMLCLGLAAVCLAAPPPQAATPGQAKAPWEREFDSVCSRTEQAMSYSVEQLTKLIERCDALQGQIDKLEETPRKVYSGRLHQCRGLYAYVLESKKNAQK